MDSVDYSKITKSFILSVVLSMQTLGIQKTEFEALYKKTHVWDISFERYNGKYYINFYDDSAEYDDKKAVSKVQQKIKELYHYKKYGFYEE